MRDCITRYMVLSSSVSVRSEIQSCTPLQIDSRFETLEDGKAFVQANLDEYSARECRFSALVFWIIDLKTDKLAHEQCVFAEDDFDFENATFADFFANV